MDKKNIAKTSLIAVSAVAIAGLAFTAPSLAATPKHKTVASATFQGKGHGDHGFGKGQKGDKGSKPALVSQDVTVTVPDDGATYEIVVSEVASAVANNAQTNGLPKNHTIVVPVTGTGSVTVSVPGLRPGSFKVDLVQVSSSQDLTVAAPVAAATKRTKAAKPAPVSQNVTVTVADDGATYELVVTEAAPAAAANVNAAAQGPRGNHTIVVPVTGTGSVTVSVPGLHPGSYKVDLVKVSSSQDLTVAAPTPAVTQ